MRAVLLILLFVAPLAAAQTASEPLIASAVDWTDGQAQTDVLALRHRGEQGPFTLHAANLHVHAVVSEAYAMEPVFHSAYALDSTSKEADYTAAELVGLPGRGDAFLFVQEAQAVASTACAEAQAANEPVPLQAPSQIEAPNPNPAIDVAQALAIEPCGDLSVCGVFTLVLWERDVEGTSDQGDVRLESGQLARPGEPDARPVLGRAQQLYLTVHDGCFAMPASGVTLFASHADVKDATTLALRDANGKLPGVGTVAGDLSLTGRLGATLSRHSDGVESSIRGQVTGAVLNGQPLAVAATAVERSAWPWLWLAAVLPVGALLWWMRARNNDPAMLLDKATRALDEDRRSRALRLTNRLLRSQPDHSGGLLLRGVTFSLLQDHRAALKDAERAFELDPFSSDRGMAALLACRAASLLDDEMRALRWLGALFAYSPSLAADAMQYPEVRRLVPGPAGYS